MSELNLDRKPTALDRKILEFLQNGGYLSHVDVLNKFKSTQSRDHFWRLRKAGHKIKDKMVYYFTAEGRRKRYKVYFLHPK
jgi:ribosomal protein S8